MSIYLDYNATAPVRPEVISRMQELLALPANPSSVHRFGREAKKHLENARKIIADAVSAWPNEIIFTASGTEANAMALRGIPGHRVLVSAVEHSSVLKQAPLPNPPPLRGRGDSAESPLPEGGRAREGALPVDSNGIIDLVTLDGALAGNAPALVSVMLANNETGVIQPIPEVAAICKKHGALLHCDAVQGLGKIPVDFGALGCDMMTISAHKCGGPVGAAALVVRRELAFAPLLTGGGQELGRRAGTENVAAIAGFAVAVEQIDLGHMRQLRGWLDTMENVISSPIRGEAGRGAGHGKAEQVSPHPNPPPTGEGIIFGASASRLPNTSCVAMLGVGQEVQLMDFDLKGFAVSVGSACSSGRIETSHVLAAMGVSKPLASCAVRISGGWQTKEQEIKAFTEAWQGLYGRLGKKTI